MHKLCERLNKREFLNTCNVSPYWQHVLSEVHTDTWHSTQGVAEVACSAIGSIPGDPRGDMMFNFVAIKIHAQIETRFRSAGLVHVRNLPPPPIPWLATMNSLYMMDLAVFHESTAYT